MDLDERATLEADYLVLASMINRTGRFGTKSFLGVEYSYHDDKTIVSVDGILCLLRARPTWSRTNVEHNDRYLHEVRYRKHEFYASTREPLDVNTIPDFSKTRVDTVLLPPNES